MATKKDKDIGMVGDELRPPQETSGTGVGPANWGVSVGRPQDDGPNRQQPRTTFNRVTKPFVRVWNWIWGR